MWGKTQFSALENIGCQFEVDLTNGTLINKIMSKPSQNKGLKDS